MRIASNTVSDGIVRQIQQLSSQQAKLQNQVATAQAEMDVLAARSKQQFPADNKDVGARLFPLATDGVSDQASRFTMARARAPAGR